MITAAVCQLNLGKIIVITSISANADGPCDAASHKIANTTLHVK